MGTEYNIVCITTEEYRELIQAKRDADCLKKAMKFTLSYSDIDLLMKLFCQQEESNEE